MAKDDYHVIVYQILSYLYQQLKKGEPVDGKMLEEHSSLFHINHKYWVYIITNLVSEGFVKGIFAHEYDQGVMIAELDKAEITPSGIEYLMGNSFMRKAHQFFKGVKECVPFV